MLPSKRSNLPASLKELLPTRRKDRSKDFFFSIEKKKSGHKKRGGSP